MILGSLTMQRDPDPSAFRKMNKTELRIFHRLESERKIKDREIREIKRFYLGHRCNPGLAEKTVLYSKESGLPSRLVATVILVESSCQQYAVSSSGAQGLMQVLPSHKKELRIDDLFDVDKNMKAGTIILARNIRIFGLYGGVALYNGGPEMYDYADRVLEISRME